MELDNNNEYVKLDLETYNDLLRKSDKLTAIDECININVTKYDQNGEKLAPGWWCVVSDSSCSKIVRKMNVELENIFNILGYDIKDYNSIILQNKSQEREIRWRY